MAKEISKGLKRTFLINFIVSLVFGVLLFFMVDIYLSWFGINFSVPFSFIGGFFGGALLTFASASFFSWQQTEWEKVKIVVIMNIVWYILGVYILFWWHYGIWTNILSHYLYTIIVHLIYLIVFFGFLTAFIFYYIKHEKEEPTARTDTELVQVVQD